MSATEPNSNLVRFPVVDRDEIEFCVPDGISDVENLLPVILQDDALGYAALGRGGRVLVHEGVRGGDGQLHAVRLPNGDIIVRVLVYLTLGRVLLQAANPDYESFEFFESQIEIIGAVVRICYDCTRCLSFTFGNGNEEPTPRLFPVVPCITVN